MAVELGPFRTIVDLKAASWYQVMYVYNLVTDTSFDDEKILYDPSHSHYDPQDHADKQAYIDGWPDTYGNLWIYDLDQAISYSFSNVATFELSDPTPDNAHKWYMTADLYALHPSDTKTLQFQSTQGGSDWVDHVPPSNKTTNGVTLIDGPYPILPPRPAS